MKKQVPVQAALSGAEQTCDEGGLVSMTKSVGDEVVEGETIAIVRDPYGNVLEQIKAPVTGWVTAYPLQEPERHVGRYGRLLYVPQGLGIRRIWTPYVNCHRSRPELLPVRTAGGLIRPDEAVRATPSTELLCALSASNRCRVLFRASSGQV